MPEPFALAIIMLPLVARATQEVLLLVPSTLREASLALGVQPLAHRSRRDPARRASAGILTGTVLAVARAAGETAPLLFTCSIFVNAVSDRRHEAAAEHPGPDLHVLRAARPCPARAGLGVRRSS